MAIGLNGKRVLVLGAETEIGRAVVTAVAEAGASVAAVAATSEAEAAFAVQRLARRLSSDERKVIAQAIDATNEAAVRVMVRQVSKELGGLDAVVLFREPAEGIRMTAWMNAMEHMAKFGWKELERRGGGTLIMITRDGFFDGDVGNQPGPLRLVPVMAAHKTAAELGAAVVAAIAAAPDSG